jgi:hypothetical protein
MEYTLLILENLIVFIVLEVYAMAKKIVKKPVPKDGAKKKLQKEALKKESQKGSAKKSSLKDSVSKKTKVQKPAPKAKASIKAVSAKPTKNNVAKKPETKKVELKKSAKVVVDKKSSLKKPPKANSLVKNTKAVKKIETSKIVPTMVTTKGKNIEKTTDKKASSKKAPNPEVEVSEVAEETIVVPLKKKKEASLENFVLDKETVKWQDLMKKFGHLDAKEYNMREIFEANIPIIHKVLGWGFVISVLNDRLEVLFEQGIKNLISNYKQV